MRYKRPRDQKIKHSASEDNPYRRIEWFPNEQFAVRHAQTNKIINTFATLDEAIAYRDAQTKGIQPVA